MGARSNCAADLPNQAGSRTATHLPSHSQELADQRAAEEAAKRAAPVPLGARLMLLVLAALYLLFAYRIDEARVVRRRLCWLCCRWLLCGVN